jgi:hypothetical protein
MPFTFSAPEMSPEEEREELEQLSTDERQKIKDHKYGEGCIEETEEMRSSGRSQLKEAMVLLPAEEKDAYLEALKRCPDVVRAETDFIAFIRADEYCIEVNCSFPCLSTIRDLMLSPPPFSFSTELSLIASFLQSTFYPGRSSTSSALLEMQTRCLWKSCLSTYDNSWCHGRRPRNTGEGVDVSASTRSQRSRCYILASDSNESDRGISLLYCKLPTPDPMPLCRFRMKLGNESIYEDVLLTPTHLSSFLLLS